MMSPSQYPELTASREPEKCNTSVHGTEDHVSPQENESGGKRMKLVTLHIPEQYVEGLEKLVESKLYPNRSEAIRIAIRDLLKRELWG